MLENLTVFKLASAMARHATARHAVIAENVANADTPAYRARDLDRFSTLVNETFRPRATRAGHLGTSPLLDAATPPAREIAYPAGPNGNSVSLADQGRRAVEATGQHRLAMTVYAKAADILRIGLGRNR